MGRGPGDSRRCCYLPQDLWCNSLPLCIAANKQGGFELPLVARFGLGADDWRCYSPSALNKAKSNYTGGPAFCTTPELASILAICNGSQPGPYPSPPTAAPPPPAGGCTTPFIADANATLVMNIGQDGTTYRIPVVMKIPGTHTVIMLSENRGHSGDSGQHKLALATSDDDGQSWSSVRNIYNDSTPGSGAGTTDGLNLGAAVWDARRKRFTVLFNECADQYGKAGSGCGPTGQLLQIDTDDLGVSWSAVANHTANLLSQGYVQLNPGPGTGVQLQHQKDASKNGRLIMPAWGKPHDYCCGLGCILPRDASNDRANRHEEGLWRTRRLERRGPDLRATADDSRGAGGRRRWARPFADEVSRWAAPSHRPRCVSAAATWRAVHVPDPGKNEPNELQCAELPSGEILLNVRSGNHPMRALSSSTDAGTQHCCPVPCSSAQHQSWWLIGCSRLIGRWRRVYRRDMDGAGALASARHAGHLPRQHDRRTLPRDTII